MNFEDLQKEMNALQYPPNHKFDSLTLEPLGNMIDRVKALKKFAPELMNGGESLLDIGCNKGFISFYLKDKYKHIEAIDPNKKFIDFAKHLQHAHDINNIFFWDYNFENWHRKDKYEVVYFGQCTHYLFRNAVRQGKHPLSFLLKAQKIAEKVIAIDGAFTLDDPSVKFDSGQDNWTKEIKDCCSIEAYCYNLPFFQLSSYNWSGDGATRSIAIFKRRAEK